MIDIELLVRDAKNPNIVHGVELPKTFTIDRLLLTRELLKVRNVLKNDSLLLSINGGVVTARLPVVGFS